MGNELIDITGGLYKEYGQLVLRRDQLRKEADSVKAVYYHKFGPLMTRSFTLQVACIRRKKEIAYLMRIVNTGGELDIDDMKKTIDAEMTAYERQLHQMMDDTADAVHLGYSTSAEVQRSKQLYRTIARLIHPDMHPEFAANDDIADLWDRTQEAYRHNYASELEEILVLVQMVISGEPVPSQRLGYDELTERIARVKGEIRQIRTTRPYTYKKILDDSDAMRHKYDELDQEIEEYGAYFDNLTEQLHALFADEGIAITWSWDDFDKEMTQWMNQMNGEDPWEDPEDEED